MYLLLHQCCMCLHKHQISIYYHIYMVFKLIWPLPLLNILVVDG